MVGEVRQGEDITAGDPATIQGWAALGDARLGWIGRASSGAVGQGQEWHCALWQGEVPARAIEVIMKRQRRQPKEIWRVTRKRVWERDSRRCVRCHALVSLRGHHCDHIIPLSRGGTNQDNNLRTLCVVCHATRSDTNHQGLVARLIERGLLPPDWRSLVWDG